MGLFIDELVNGLFQQSGAFAKLEDRREQAGECRLQLGPQRDEAARALLAMVDDAGQPQHLQVMAERRLGHAAVELAGPALLPAGKVGNHRESHGIAQRMQNSRKRELLGARVRQLPGLLHRR